MKLYPNITYIFSIWLITVLLIAFFSFSTFPHSGKFSNDFWQSFRNWDGGHFLGIAEFGYKEKFQYAFFPLYPLVIKLLTQITQNYFVAAILVSVVATFLGLHLLYKLVILDFGKKIAEKTVLAFLFFPTSFFLLTAYSEGLFFLLAVATFYFLRQNKLFWAIVFAVLASATRVVGLAVVAGLLIDVLVRGGFNRKNWYAILAFSGFFIYSIFLYRQTGDPFYFVTAQNYWQRIITPPGLGFWETLKSISAPGFLTSNFNGFLDLIFAIFGVGFAFRSLRFLPPSWAVYTLAAVGIPLFTPTLSSMPRFLLPVFPLFILIALVKHKYLSLGMELLFIMLLALFTSLFAAGYWVS